MPPNNYRRIHELEERIREVKQRLDEAKQAKEKYRRKAYISNGSFEVFDHLLLGSVLGGAIGGIPMAVFPDAYWLSIAGAVIGAVWLVNGHVKAKDSEHYAALEEERLKGELRTLRAERDVL